MNTLSKEQVLDVDAGSAKLNLLLSYNVIKDFSVVGVPACNTPKAPISGMRRPLSQSATRASGHQPKAYYTHITAYTLLKVKLPTAVVRGKDLIYNYSYTFSFSVLETISFYTIPSFFYSILFFSFPL